MSIERQDAPQFLHAIPDELPAPVDGRKPQELHVHHERELGIGYGNSSGYGVTLHFFDGHVDPMFRLRW